MADQVWVQVRFRTPTEVGEYQDALYYPLSDYAGLGQAKIDDEKAARAASYVSAMKNPPAPIVPTKQQLQDAKAQLVAQVADLDVKIAAAK